MPRRRLPNLGLSGPLYHGLHTRCLRFAAPGYPDATQDSLPVGGQSLPGRVLTYRVHYEGFPFLSIAFSFPPSQAWPGARHVAWGVSPRKRAPNKSKSPLGATAVFPARTAVLPPRGRSRSLGLGRGDGRDESPSLLPDAE